MRHSRAFLGIALVVGATVRAGAFAADGCEQQRKQYPANWNDTSAERTLFICESQQVSTSKSEQPTRPTAVIVGNSIRLASKVESGDALG